MKRKKPVRQQQRVRTLIIAAVILVVAAGLAYHYTRPKTPPTITVQQAGAIKSNSPSKVTTLPYQPPVVNPTSKVPGGVTPSTSPVSLAAPEGSFVNNHGSSSNPVVASSQEESTCTTTPGATCQITFTQGSLTKSLPAQQTSTSTTKDAAAGSTVWFWTPQQVGLTTGQWQITATASLQGKTQSTQDEIKLLISQ